MSVCNQFFWVCLQSVAVEKIHLFLGRVNSYLGARKEVDGNREINDLETQKVKMVAGVSQISCSSFFLFFLDVILCVFH